MTWKKFKNNANLIKATKEIATLKFQEYILRKISDETSSIKQSDRKEDIKTKIVIR